jgi:hypothetical protein
MKAGLNIHVPGDLERGQRQNGQLLRIVSRPFSPDSARTVRFGFFANGFRARRAVRIARIK